MSKITLLIPFYCVAGVGFMHNVPDVCTIVALTTAELRVNSFLSPEVRLHITEFVYGYLGGHVWL